MKSANPFAAILVTLLFVTGTFAQRTEITIGLSEQFFDTVIDAIFLHSQPPKFSIASKGNSFDGDLVSRELFRSISYSETPSDEPARCDESIRLLRESGGVRTAVRFRDGRIFTPLSFTGNYNPPLVGCVEFSGWAETNINLEFDQVNQRLVAKAHVNNVNLNGTRGVGSSIIARMVQSSIDKRVNPIEILRLDKISFMLPIQNSDGILMKAVGVRNEITNGALTIHITYEFQKA